MRASAAARGHLDDHDGELRSEGTAIGPSLSVGEAAFAVMRRNFEAFVARERGTRLGEDPEELHDMRVASRRMRGAIALFREALPARALRLRDEIEWVAGALGAVRDLDVQLEQLESWSKWDADVNRTSLAALRDLFDVERADARGELLKALDSPRYARLLDGTRRLLDGSPLRRPLASRTPIAVAGASLLGRRYRAMRRAGDRIGEESAAEDYHRLRIRCKRLRYALEFLADVYPDGTGPLIRRLMALQTLLGMQQDADVAVRRLAALATREGGRLPPPTVFAMGMVAERYADQGRDLRARFPKVYGKVRGRPWKELQLVMREAASAHASAPASTRNAEGHRVELLLVRHAIAFNRDPDRWPADGDRPLTPQGEARFRKAARGLRTLVPSVELVLSSPYTRAWRTAEILTEETGWPAPQPSEALEAERSRSDAVGAIRSQAGHGSLALVGHEPNLSELASFLLTGSERRLFMEMKKGGVACLALPDGLAGGKGVLRWVATPKMLRAMATEG